MGPPAGGAIPTSELANDGCTSARRPNALEKIWLAIAFLRESSDFLVGVIVESKEIFDPNTVCMAGLALSAHGRVGSGAARSDIAIEVFAGGLRAFVPEKFCLIIFLGCPPEASVLSSDDIFQDLLVLALSAPGWVGP